MKKILAFALAVVMVFALAACGGSGKEVASVDDLPGATIGVQLGTTGDRKSVV